MAAPAPDALGEIYFALCKSVNSAVSLTCWLLYKYGEHEQLARKKVQPQQYDDCDLFRDDYLVVSYLSKYKGLDTKLDIKAIALDGFTAAEAACKETNVRLRRSLVETSTVEPLITEAVRKIGRILGELSILDAFSDCRWGKGATSTLTSEEANLVTKMDPGMGTISVTKRALKWMKIHIESDPHWASAIFKAEVLGPFSLLPRAVFSEVRGNKVTTVPKDATKERTIAAEPTANIWLQLGVGRLLRKLLRKRAGIDLNDQSKNRKYAQLGSLSGRYATIDLKSASDTVSRELVKQLLPYEWFELLDQLRSPEGTVDGSNWFVYEKFSSMGNGYTFELETLIFYALSSAVVEDLGCKGRVLVYGDDIVVPVEAYAKLTEVLQFCGFEANVSKSFADGYFRESCGGHYWQGTDVTPIYQKEVLQYDRERALRARSSSRPKGREVDLPEAYRCANRLIRLAYRRGQSIWLDRKLEAAWRAARRSLDLLRPLHVVPLNGQTDDGLALPWDELSTHLRVPRASGWNGIGTGMFTLRCLLFKPLRLKVNSFMQGALLAYWLRQSWREYSDEPGPYPRPDSWGFPSEFIMDFLQVRDQSFAGSVMVRRRGTYGSRRRAYLGGTPNVAWS